MTKPGHEEWVSRYLDGDLTGAERLAFEAELRADPDLGRLVNLYANCRDLLRRSYREEPPPLRLTLKAMGLAPAARSRLAWAGPWIACGLSRTSQRVRGHQGGRSFRRVGLRLVFLARP